MQIAQFKSQLDAASLSALTGARLIRSGLFPAAAYLEMALSASSQILDGGAITLADVEFSDPLPLPSAGEFQTLQTIANPCAGREAAIEFYSLHEEDGEPWLLVLKNIDFADYRATFTDAQPKTPAVFVLDKVHVTAANITNGPDEKGRVDLDLRVNETATLKIGGSVGLTPLALNLDLGLQGVPFKAAQPYLDSAVNGMD